MFARVVHGREVAAGDEGNLVAIAVVIRSEKSARVFIFLAGVIQRQPTDGPCHSAVWAAAGEGLTPRADMERAVGWGLVLSNGTVRRDLDLIHANNRDVSHESPLERRRSRARKRTPGQSVIAGRSKRKGTGCSGCTTQEFSSGPEMIHLPSYRSTFRSSSGSSPQIFLHAGFYGRIGFYSTLNLF